MGDVLPFRTRAEREAERPQLEEREFVCLQCYNLFIASMPQRCPDCGSFQVASDVEDVVP